MSAGQRSLLYAQETALGANGASELRRGEPVDLSWICAEGGPAGSAESSDAALIDARSSEKGCTSSELQADMADWPDDACDMTDAAGLSGAASSCFLFLPNLQTEAPGHPSDLSVTGGPGKGAGRC